MLLFSICIVTICSRGDYGDEEDGEDIKLKKEVANPDNLGKLKIVILACDHTMSQNFKAVASKINFSALFKNYFRL